MFTDVMLKHEMFTDLVFRNEIFTDLVFKDARVESRGEGLQHLLGATKRAFSASYLRSFGLGICTFSKKFLELRLSPKIPTQID